MKSNNNLTQREKYYLKRQFGARVKKCAALILSGALVFSGVYDNVNALKNESAARGLYNLKGQVESYYNMGEIEKAHEEIDSSDYLNIAEEEKAAFYNLPEEQQLDYIENVLQKKLGVRLGQKAFSVCKFILSAILFKIAADKEQDLDEVIVQMYLDPKVNEKMYEKYSPEHLYEYGSVNTDSIRRRIGNLSFEDEKEEERHKMKNPRYRYNKCTAQYEQKSEDIRKGTNKFFTYLKEQYVPEMLEVVEKMKEQEKLDFLNNTDGKEDKIDALGRIDAKNDNIKSAIEMLGSYNGFGTLRNYYLRNARKAGRDAFNRIFSKIDSHKDLSDEDLDKYIRGYIEEISIDDPWSFCYAKVSRDIVLSFPESFTSLDQFEDKCHEHFMQGFNKEAKKAIYEVNKDNETLSNIDCIKHNLGRVMKNVAIFEEKKINDIDVSSIRSVTYGKWPVDITEKLTDEQIDNIVSNIAKEMGFYHLLRYLFINNFSCKEGEDYAHSLEEEISKVERGIERFKETIIDSLNYLNGDDTPVEIKFDLDKYKKLYEQEVMEQIASMDIDNFPIEYLKEYMWKPRKFAEMCKENNTELNNG